tara:strand:+ start:1118 stop:1282 length:165 start_codon:yes stop_codon:yes gene_type:complete
MAFFDALIKITLSLLAVVVMIGVVFPLLSFVYIKGLLFVASAVGDAVQWLTMLF